MHKRTLWIFITAATVFGAAAWWSVHARSRNNAGGKSTTKARPTDGKFKDTEDKEKSRSSKPSANKDFPLSLGSSGEKVQRLQVWLLRNVGGKVAVTGEFDHPTKALLQRTLATDTLDEETFYQLGMDQPVYRQQAMR